MDTVAIIAEYNPFHLGHVKHISYVKNVLKAKNVIVVMSGNFTQRGEPAVMDKFTRAKHAVLAGADMVVELPTVFATANAEVFAKGAVKIIESLGVVDGLCFGVESGEKDDYIKLAAALNDESKEFKKILKEQLEKGVSLAKAKFETLKLLGKEFDESLISTPNNILGIEYTKALLSLKSNIEICPMIRTGDHNDKTLKKGITSATSIREVLKTGKVKKLKKNLPDFTYRDLAPYPFVFDKLIMASVVKTPHEEMAKILDCTEGLENRIKALAKDNVTVGKLTDKVVTKRYTITRVNRILISTLLGISADLVKDALISPLYAKVLALSNDRRDLLSAVCEKSVVPVLSRKSDFASLKKTAQKCFEKDVLANDLYGLATENRQNENHMIIV